METTIEKIGRKTGRKVNECKCTACKMQCQKTPCLPTPEDVIKLINAGYSSRLKITVWLAGIVGGVTDKPIKIIAPEYDESKHACTFFTAGLCELHNSGLKPTEGKLSNHALQMDNFKFSKSLSWNVVKEWEALPPALKLVLFNHIHKASKK